MKMKIQEEVREYYELTIKLETTQYRSLHQNMANSLYYLLLTYCIIFRSIPKLQGKLG